TAYLKIGFKVASTTTALFGQGNYTLVGVPAPGALALLGMAGFMSRRRR
ncbi:MAG: PEP-CTERM sorting domain-containing protein, partial [Phycisphaerales bacterium]|nr:PEP-CTERM sorting domain-containing protein [Phycisphaerales bacterium]